MSLVAIRTFVGRHLASRVPGDFPTGLRRMDGAARRRLDRGRSRPGRAARAAPWVVVLPGWPADVVVVGFDSRFWGRRGWSSSGLGLCLRFSRRSQRE